MLELPNYSPSMWIDDEGLLTRMVKRVAATTSRMVRAGKWSSRKQLMTLTVSVAMAGSVGVSAAYSQVVQLDLFVASASHDGGSNTPSKPVDLVPDGYWDKLNRAMKSAQRFPAQDLAKDPPVLV